MPDEKWKTLGREWDVLCRECNKTAVITKPDNTHVIFFCPYCGSTKLDVREHGAKPQPVA